MSIFEDAVSWSGSDVVFCLFVASPIGASEISGSLSGPKVVRRYTLEDLEDRFPSFVFREYDLVFESYPSGVDLILTNWIEAALSAGGQYCWFGFEGSFSFDHIFTSDVVEQIFATGSAERISIAIDDEMRIDKSWGEHVQELRRKFEIEMNHTGD